MFFDFEYILFILLPTMVISGIASSLVKSAFAKYDRVPSRRGMTGAQAAQRLLDRAGISDVSILPTQGHLSDHYNPMNRQLVLSESVYHGNSVAAIGVATHEAGHAIQHATGYAPLWIRSMLVPVAGIGSQLGFIGLAIGAALTASQVFIGPIILWAGVALFGCMFLFQLVTLPVEFNASLRARKLVVEAGIIDADERTGVDRVLTAAAMTYVAAAVTTAMTLIFFLLRAYGSRD